MIRLFYIFSVFQLGAINFAGAVNECQLTKTCGECISFMGMSCAWCDDVFYKAGEKSYHKKCDSLENHVKQNCGNITNPKSDFEPTKNEELGEGIRVSPQEIKIKLRRGQAKTVPITVKIPKDYPIDLYYLMDLSSSMKDDLKQIQSLGERLSTQLKEVTANFRLGFGGFVDKPTGPYTKTDREEELYKKKYPDIATTFSYKNFLPLSDGSKFKEAVEKVPISHNDDTPEGSLDALMQVIVCGSHIGWRNKNEARKIVIITTDSTFHYSGDGLLGGFVQPNDGICYMVNKTYTAWDRYDYPSLSQIRARLIESNIVPIFATTGNTELYKSVAKFLGNGAQTEKLKKDSSNVVELIKKAYDTISQTVTINAFPPEGIKVNIKAICGDQGAVEESEGHCKNIGIGNEVTFNVTITSEICELENPTFTLETSYDDVNVTVELICDCDCGDNDNKIVDAEECTSRGNLSCGMCFCDKTKWGGRFCQCTKEESKNQTLCKIPGVKEICDGRGTCDCGECLCNPLAPNENGDIEIISGNQCKCSNVTCGRSNKGQICGGPDRGECVCNECECNSDWTGLTCNEKCAKSKSECSDSGEICNGRGSCECNKCNCAVGYVGKYCSECYSNCPDPCRDYRECVKCKVFETSDFTEEECEFECSKWNITSYLVVDKIDDDRCLERDEDDCSFVFTFKENNVTEEVTLLVQRDRICPAEPDILAIILGVIAGIVGIGLALLLIWKLLATIQDRREFAKFENDVHNPKWDSGENPIYKKATSTFQNPMYGDKGGDPNDAGNALIE